MTTITLYKPNGDTLITYKDPSSVSVEDGVLTFYWKIESSMTTKKVVTTVPFMVEEDCGSI